MKTSVHHTEAKFNECIIKFNTSEPITITIPAGDGKDLINEVAQSIIYKYGYEEAAKLFNVALNRHKYTWQE